MLLLLAAAGMVLVGCESSDDATRKESRSETSGKNREVATAKEYGAPDGNASAQRNGEQSPKRLATPPDSQRVKEDNREPDQTEEPAETGKTGEPAEPDLTDEPAKPMVAGGAPPVDARGEEEAPTPQQLKPLPPPEGARRVSEDP